MVCSTIQALSDIVVDNMKLPQVYGQKKRAVRADLCAPLRLLDAVMCLSVLVAVHANEHLFTNIQMHLSKKIRSSQARSHVHWLRKTNVEVACARNVCTQERLPFAEHVRFTSGAFITVSSVTMILCFLVMFRMRETSFFT